MLEEVRRPETTPFGVGIDVTISIYGEQYYDTVIDVHAVPLPPQPNP